MLQLKVKTTDTRTTKIYALLDNGSQSTLVREDFAETLKLKGHKKTIPISSAINKVQEVKVKEVALKIQDLREEKINYPSQH